MEDIHSCVFIDTLIANATYAADTTPAAVDLQGFDAAEIVLALGAGGITFNGSNKIEFVLTHSDDGTTYTNVADADMMGVSGIQNGIIKALVAAQNAAIVRFGYKGCKRYLKLLADFSGTHGTGTPIGAYVIKGEPALAPTAAQA
jgi:hypothetical protein